ncbi:MAG: ROK family protein [Schleiferilactobacillus harbinensis]|jgi:predicted NBD/HSP70 family sugar kinase|nr:ROK family protein [Schleiferilactobacillus harbinensis]MCI1912153.1 ROK family protein [Schleiferilactobacillus harbinensis]
MTKAVLAIDVGGTKTMACVFSGAGEVIFKKIVLSDMTSQVNSASVIKGLIDQALQLDGVDVTAIAVDAVGQVDPESGTWYGINRVIKETIPLAANLQEQYQIPCFALNDVYAAAFAELTHGIGCQTQDFIYLNIGTGIAGRVVVAGHILNGIDQYAGEFGHAVVDFNSSVQCTCGRYGCVETFASGLGMSNAVKRLMRDGEDTTLQADENGRIPVQRIMQAVATGDAVAEIVAEQAARGIAALISNLIRENNPAAVVIGGGVVNNSAFASRVSNQLDPEALRLVKYGVTRTKLDPSLVAAVGAAAYARYRLTS